MLWVVGYLVSGIVAVIFMAIYIMVILPHVCGYVIDDWMDFCLEYLKCDQSKLENCIGTVLTMILWPLKIVWISCELIPAMLDAYEAQFEKD